VCDPTLCDGAALFPTYEDGNLGEPITGRDGDTIFVDIRVKDTVQPISAFGFTVHVDPTHLTLLEAVAGDLTAGFHTVDAQETPAGSGTIICGGYSSTEIPADSDGVLIRLAFEVTCQEGETSEITIDDLIDHVAGLATCCNTFTCVACKSDGDVNGDRALSADDPYCAFRIYLNAQNLPEACDIPNFECELAASDVDCNGRITPLDALAIFERFLQGLPPWECFAESSPFQRRAQSTARQLTLSQHRVALPDGATGSELLKVSLLVDRPEGLRAFGLRLSYPAGKLEFRGVQRATMTSDWLQLDGVVNQSGVITIGGFNNEALTATKAGELFSVLFAVNGEPDASPEIALFDLVDDFENATVTAVGSGDHGPAAVPQAFKLYQNFPNPLSGGINKGMTAIRFDLPGPAAERVELSIFNVTGQLVRRLVSGVRKPGAYNIAWDGKDENGRQVPSGTYWYRLEAGKRVESKQLTIVR